MGKELYVRHISEKATGDDIQKLFSVAGTVTSVHMITDPDTGQFKGCAFVKMATDSEAKEAIETLDGALLINRVIMVGAARPQTQKPGKPAGYSGKSAKGDHSRRSRK